MRKRMLCILIVLVLAGSMMPQTFAAGHAFSDVPVNAWYADYVDYVYDHALMNGMSANQFGPGLAMTRGMLVTVLYRYEGCPMTSEQAPFTDLKEGAYYVAAVTWAYENEIVEGTSKTTFSPNENVTRQQIVAIFYRYAAYLGWEVDKQADLSSYSDNGSISEYAVDAFAWATAEGIINGENGLLNPKGNAPRSQCAAIISRFDGYAPVKRTSTTLQVLMYHSVAADGALCGDWTVTESKFRQQMQWLSDHGYTTVLPSELASGKLLPEKAVLITFDDGYSDNYYRAFPILEEFGHKAVISVITSYMEDEEGRFLTWRMCQEMMDSGLVEIGSHTHNCHRYPGIQRLENESWEAYQARVISDIQHSIDLIEENLGVTPVFIAYPHGIADEWAGDFVRANFTSSVITIHGVNDLSSGLYNLYRYNINDKSVLSNYLA